MAGRIPKSFIDELIARADIVEVVGARVTLKRAGSNYKGLCPFHGEKTPSFTVSPSKGFYHCFGCSAHGTAIGFLMAYDNLEFPEAVEALAEMMGLEVPRENTGVPERKDDNDELYALLREADQIYRAALREQREGDRVLEEARHRRADGGPLRHRLRARMRGTPCSRSSAPPTRASRSSCKPGSSSRTTPAAATTASAIASCSRSAARAATSSASAAACSKPASRST